MMHSQGFLFVFHFLGLTEKQMRNCVRIETKKRIAFFTKKSVKEECTTNKMSEKYEGNSTLS